MTVPETTPESGTSWVLALVTGLRQDEALGSQWDDIYRRPRVAGSVRVRHRAGAPAGWRAYLARLLIEVCPDISTAAKTLCRQLV